MIPVQYNKQISLEFTPHQVAEMFCSMDADDMALFFNHINDFVGADYGIIRLLCRLQVWKEVKS